METDYQQDAANTERNISNVSTEYTNTLDDPYGVVASIEAFAVPIICIFGFIGNTISAFVFLSKGLRGNSSSLFLAARSISDNGFLAILLTTWMSSVLELRLANILGLCQAVIFFTYFFGCISVWLVVFVTAENYIRICKPFLVRQVCKTTNAKISVIVLLASVLGIYNFPFWTMQEHCVPSSKYHDFIQVMVYLDTVLTLIIPSTIMAVLSSAMVASAVASCKRRRRMSKASTTSAKSPLTKVTTMLLAVTLIFFVLNLPHHLIRLRLMIMAFVEKQNVSAMLPLEITLQSVSQMLYFLSLAVNILVYSCFSSKFRMTLKDIVLRKNTNASNQARRRIPIHPMQRTHLSLQQIPGNSSDKDLMGEESVPLRRFQSSLL